MKVPPAAAPWPAPLLGRAAAPFLSRGRDTFFFLYMQTTCGEQSGNWRLQPTFETNHGRGAPSVNEPGDTPVRAGMTSRLEAALTQRAVTGAAEGNQSLVSEVTVH